MNVKWSCGSERQGRCPGGANPISREVMAREPDMQAKMITTAADEPRGQSTSLTTPLPAPSPPPAECAISFCCTLKNRADNFRRFLAGLAKLPREESFELVVADFSSTDIDLPRELRSHLADAAHRIVSLEGPFNRSRGLNASAAASRGRILFFVDADMMVPENFCQLLQTHVKPGQAYFPICYSLREGSPPEHDAPGWWRDYGYGMCGFCCDDFRAIGGWNESYVTWGREDDEIFELARRHVTVVRAKCPGLFHLWHPDDLAFKQRYHVSGSLGRPPVTWHVVVPCYNYGRYLEEAVHSALANDVDLAVTIVDDASTDHTPRVARSLAEHDGRVSYIRHRDNRDVSASRNDGITLRNSVYVALLDADDKFGADYLRQAEHVLRDADVACPDVYFFGSDVGCCPVPETVSLDMFKQRNPIAYCSAFRRAVWQQLGGFDEAMSSWQDFDFWISTAKSGASFRRCPGKHFFYRRHGKSKTTQSDARSRQTWQYIYRKHSELYVKQPARSICTQSA